MNDQWYWACIRLITVPKDKTPKHGIVWDNLIIVKGKSVEQAVSKAEEIGKESGGDALGSLRLDGHPAVQKYLGICDMGLIYEDLSDGSEILFHESRKSLSTARSGVKKKARLIAKMSKQITPSIKVATQSRKK